MTPIDAARQPTPIPHEPEAAHAPDGVDVSLIRWFLTLTPAERLRTLETHVRAVLELRERRGRA